MEKKEPSYTVDGNFSWCSHYGKQHGVSLKKKKKSLKIELLYDPATPFLGIYLEKTKQFEKICICPMFIAALFMIAKT